VTPWHAVLIAVSTGNVVVFWLFARALFDDTFEVRRWHAAPWAAVVALSLTNCLLLVPAQILDPRVFAIAISVISLGFCRAGRRPNHHVLVHRPGRGAPAAAGVRGGRGRGLCRLHAIVQMFAPSATRRT